MDVCINAVKSLLKGCDEETRIDCEEVLIENYQDLLKIPDFFKIPMNSICSIVKRIPFDDTYLQELITKLVENGREDTPMILNAIDPGTDPVFVSMVKIISCITTSKLCAKFEDAYKEESCLSYIDPDNVSQSSEISSYSKDLIEAIKNNDLSYIKGIKENGELDVEKGYTDSCYTLLHFAAKNGKLEIVKYLIEECEANVDSENCDESTPLHQAIKGRNIDIVKYLIEEKKASITKRDSSGRNALIIATLCNSYDIIKYLIEQCKAKPEKTDLTGNTPLHIAVQNRNLKVIKYLVENVKVNIDPINQKGMSPLHYAAKSKPAYIIDYLIKHGANMDIKAKNGQTPEDFCKKREGGIKNHFEKIKFQKKLNKELPATQKTKKEPESKKLNKEPLATQKPSPVRKENQNGIEAIKKVLKNRGISDPRIRIMTSKLNAEEIKRLNEDNDYFEEWQSRYNK